MPGGRTRPHVPSARGRSPAFPALAILRVCACLPPDEALVPGTLPVGRSFFTASEGCSSPLGGGQRCGLASSPSGLLSADDAWATMVSRARSQGGAQGGLPEASSARTCSVSEGSRAEAHLNRASSRLLPSRWLRVLRGLPAALVLDKLQRDGGQEVVRHCQKNPRLVAVEPRFTSLRGD